MATSVRNRSSKRRRILSAVLLIAVVLVILLLRLVEEIGPERHPSDRFVVRRIIDGDTVELLGGDRLRLLAIDTPEQGELFHDEATDLLGRLTLGKPAVIEFAGRRRDRYGRLLGYLYIDSLFINKTMMDSGLGYVYLFRDNELETPQVARLLEAQRGAINRGVGLWSVEREAEEYYVSSVNSFRLHRPGCRSVEGILPENARRFAVREEGLSLGLSPCRNCKP